MSYAIHQIVAGPSACTLLNESVLNFTLADIDPRWATKEVLKNEISLSKGKYRIHAQRTDNAQRVVITYNPKTNKGRWMPE